MNIIKVSYEKLFPTAPYLNEKIGFEAEINEEKETPEQVLSQLSEIAEEWHKANNPHLYQEIKPATSGYASAALPIQVPEIYYTEQIPSTDVLSLIQTAPDLETLKSFKVIAGSPGNEELYKAYNNRVAELIPNVKTK